MNGRNNHGMTPFYFACWNSENSALSLLLTLGAEVNSLASGKITPLHLAVASLNVVSVDILLDANCDIHVQSLSSLEEVTGLRESYYSDLFGTPLHWAVSRGLVDATKAPLARGADARVKNAVGLSAFTIAALRHDAFMLKILFECPFQSPLPQTTRLKSRMKQL